jgi:hypothetical protein
LKNPELIRLAWESYRAHVVPAGAEAVQINETKLAFFAGAQALFSIINAVMTEDRDVTEEDIRNVSYLDQELRDFAEWARKRAGL